MWLATVVALKCHLPTAAPAADVQLDRCYLLSTFSQPTLKGPSTLKLMYAGVQAKWALKGCAGREKQAVVKVVKLLHLGADLHPDVTHRPDVQSIVDCTI
jgi:hypothetical protein